MSEYASAVAEKVINSITPLFGEVKRDILGSVASMFEEVKIDIKNVEKRLDDVEKKLETKIDDVEKKLETKIGDVERRLETKIGDVEKKLETKIGDVEKKLETKIGDVERKLEFKIGGLGVQMGQMNLKIDTALSLAGAVPDLEDSHRSHGSRLKKVETDIEVLKLVVSRPAK